MPESFDPAQWEEIAEEHEHLGDIANAKCEGAGDYDRGVAQGIRMVMGTANG